MASPTFNNPSSYGVYTPSTELFDVGQLYSIDVNSPEFKELLVRLYLVVNRMNIAGNLKDSGYYDTQEFVNGQQYFPNPSLTSSSTTTPTFRPVYRKVFLIGTLPNTGVLTVAHGISVTTMTSFTRIYGVANDPIGLLYAPLPYASPVLANTIELSLDATNIIITTGSNRTNFTLNYVIVEFLNT